MTNIIIQATKLVDEFRAPSVDLDMFTSRFSEDDFGFVQWSSEIFDLTGLDIYKKKNKLRCV